jgi:hypothetical protein
MKAHDWFVDHRADYVARALEPGDDALFRDHLARCSECAAEIAAIERDLAWLPLAAQPVPPRPGFAQRVRDQIVRRPGRLSRWIWPAVAAAVALLALGLWRRDQGRILDLERQLAERSAELAGARDSLASAMGADQVVQAAIEQGGKRGGMLILADQATHRWKIVVHGIPAAPAGQRYTFWFITGDGMVRGAEVICDENNPAVIVLDMPRNARLIKGGSLTVEPMTGDASVPRGKEIAHLEL